MQIPDKDTAVEQLHSVATGLTEMVSQLALPIAQQLHQHVTEIQEPINRFEARVNQQLGRRTADISKLMNQIDVPIPSHGVTRTPQPTPKAHRVPVPTPTSGGGECGFTACDQQPPQCPQIPGAQYWCLKWSVEECNYSSVECTTQSQIEIVAEKLHGTVEGPWYTYQDAYECCCAGVCGPTAQPQPEILPPHVTVPKQPQKQPPVKREPPPPIVPTPKDQLNTACPPTLESLQAAINAWGIVGLFGPGNYEILWDGANSIAFCGGTRRTKDYVPPDGWQVVADGLSAQAVAAFENEIAPQFGCLGVAEGCPPGPPAPTLPPSGGGEQPTQPTQPGTSCDSPLYISICKPPQSTLPSSGGGNQVCTTDEFGNVVCQPPQQQGGNIGQMLCQLTPDGSLPAVGSPEWCGCLDAITKFFADVGATAMQAIGVDPANPTVPLGQSNQSSLLQVLSVLPVIGPVITALQMLVGTGAQQVTQALQQVVGSQILGTGTELIGISICRTVLMLFKRFRIGTDAGLWATVDLDISIDQLERILDYASNYAFPVEVPSPSEAIECYLQNNAPEGQIRCWFACHGANFDVYQPVINARREKLSVDEVIETLRRDGADAQTIEKNLRDYGWILPEEARRRNDLYDEYPNLSDLLHWLQRNVYDAQYVQDYDLADGFEDRFWATFQEYAYAKGITKDRAYYDYVAHWINPAPGELREMVYRLRPDKEGVQNPFTLQDYGRILAEQDVAPYFRPRFQEIAYKVPALGYVRDMYRSYIIEDAELKSIHQDLGYSEQDSQRFLQIDQLTRAKMRAAEGYGWSPGALARNYATGQIDDSFVQRQMEAFGYTPDETQALMDRAQADYNSTIVRRARSRVQFSVLAEIKTALAVGVVSADNAVQQITALGWPQQFAQGWVEVQQQSANIGVIKSAIGRIKSAFMAGHIDGQNAINLLSQLGVQQTNVDQYLSIWTIGMTPKRKQRSAAQVINDLSFAEISEAEAIQRLNNLGYQDSDVRLYLADAARKILAREASAAAATARNERAAANEAQRLINEADKQKRQLLSQLKKLSPPSKMQKWAALGRMGRDVFYERFRTLGYDDVDTQRFWDEACSKSTAQCSETTPAEAGPPSGATGSGYPGIPPSGPT